jgi:hypothetical protein
MNDFRAFLLVAAGALAAALPAQDPTPQAPPAPPATKETPRAAGIETWIGNLGSDSYRARLDAERALRDAGEAAVPALQRAAESSDDPEVQWRARRVLRQIERNGAADLVQRDRKPASAPSQQPGAAPRRAGRDGVREQFESLFENFERDFGIDIPRARFFDDDFFRDLQQQMQNGVSRSQGMSMQIGPDGAVRVEVKEKGEDGKAETKVYEAPDLETFQKQYPDVMRKNGLGMGLFQGNLPWPGDAQWRAFGGGQPLRGWVFDQDGAQPWTVKPGRPAAPAPDDVQLAERAPAPPAVGKRLGVTIREVPDGVREYLGLDAGQGLMVDGVGSGTLAESLGLAAGDIVTHVGDRAIASPQDVQEALAPIKKGDDVVIRFVRKGVEKTATAAKTEDVEAGKPAERLERRDRKGDSTIR